MINFIRIYWFCWGLFCFISYSDHSSVIYNNKNYGSLPYILFIAVKNGRITLDGPQCIAICSKFKMVSLLLKNLIMILVVDFFHNKSLWLKIYIHLINILLYSHLLAWQQLNVLDNFQWALHRTQLVFSPILPVLTILIKINKTGGARTLIEGRGCISGSARLVSFENSFIYPPPPN